MVQQVEMTHAEQVEVLEKVPVSDLINMLINCNDILKRIVEHDTFFKSRSTFPLEWSPVENEYIAQEKKMRELFPNYENDQPGFQRLNFFLQSGLHFEKCTKSIMSQEEFNRNQYERNR